MTPAETILTICRFLEAELGDLRPEGGDRRKTKGGIETIRGVERKITVYPYFLPEPSPVEMSRVKRRKKDGEEIPDSYEGMYPAVVVSPVSFDDAAFHDCRALLAVSIIVCVYSEDPRNIEGPWAIMNIMERIRCLFLQYRILDEACEIVEPLSWVMYDNSQKPLWFGEMTTQWDILASVRVDATDWRGDFVFEKEGAN